MTAKLWIDVEAVEYARSNPRPSGIQWLAFGIHQTLQARHGDKWRVQFVRHDTMRNSFRVMPWHEVAALFAGTHRTGGGATRRPAKWHLAPSASAPAHSQAGATDSTALRPIVNDVLLAQTEILRAWSRLAGAPLRMRVRAYPGGERVEARNV